MRRLRLGLVLAALAAPAVAMAETKAPATPWVRHVPPDRFCIGFGSFDWLRYMRDTDALARQGRKTAAAERSRALGEALWYLGRGTGRICSCGPKDAVLADLRRMLPELERRPAIAFQDMTAAAQVEGVIAGIEAGGVAVVATSNAGCAR